MVPIRPAGMSRKRFASRNKRFSSCGASLRWTRKQFPRSDWWQSTPSSATSSKRSFDASLQVIDIYREKVEKKGEPLFAKNLENVQGDERDYIFISLTYGREPGATAMKQRFGPINGKQGHRRLNVLFSRARIRIGLFASFGSADVRPSEVSAQGVHVL